MSVLTQSGHERLRIAAHILLPAFTIGCASFIAELEALKTRDRTGSDH
jgi:hypothetical protein